MTLFQSHSTFSIRTVDHGKPGHSTDSSDDDDLTEESSVLVLSDTELPPRHLPRSHPIRRKTTIEGNQGLPNETTASLRAKLLELHEKVQLAEFEAAAERQAREKKEHNLRKLARELKRRFEKSSEDATKIRLLEESLHEAREEILLTKSKIRQQEDLNDRILDAHRAEVERHRSQARDSMSRAEAERDARVASLSESHAKTCRELSLQLRRARRELDRLRRPHILAWAHLPSILPKFQSSWNFVWNVFCRSCEDATSRTRRNGIGRGGLPFGSIRRWWMRRGCE